MTHLLPALGFLLLLAGCSPTKGYPGPKRPPEQISLIRFSNSPSVNLQSRSLNGQRASSRGIHVLPGEQVFEVHAEIQGQPKNCIVRSNFNSYGFHRCRKRRKRSYCDCRDYTRVYRDCVLSYWPASCSGNLQTKAGQNYTLLFHLEDDELQVRSLNAESEQESETPLTEVECSTGEEQSRIQRYDEGSNYYHGSYYCGY